MDAEQAMKARQQRHEIESWWLDIQDYWMPLVDLMAIVGEVEEDQVIKKCIDELNIHYSNIQNSACPDAADEVYTHVVRAVMNLRQTFEAVSQSDFVEADYTYQQLESAYNGVYAGLQDLGILGY